MNTSAKAILALGSNLGDTTAHLQNAIKEISKLCGSVTKVSSIYTTKPLPAKGIEQGNFRNLVLLLETELSPKELLRKTLSIESKLGRVRENSIHWGPREVDIDIITYGEKIINAPGITVPHPRYRERDFVLIPIQEIAPEFIDPMSGDTIKTLVQNLSEGGNTILYRNK